MVPLYQRPPSPSKLRCVYSSLPSPAASACLLFGLHICRTHKRRTAVCDPFFICSLEPFCSIDSTFWASGHGPCWGLLPCQARHACLVAVTTEKPSSHPVSQVTSRGQITDTDMLPFKQPSIASVFWKNKPFCCTN